MKSCPTCKRVFPDDAGFCPADGTALAVREHGPRRAVADDPRIGTRLCDRYEIRRVVADGGMGRVYEGIDKQTNTRIAVKVLHDDVVEGRGRARALQARVRDQRSSCRTTTSSRSSTSSATRSRARGSSSWSSSTARSSGTS